jgi:hypothetical protein
MGTSRPYVLSYICERIIEEKPKFILDIGIGFGKYGFLAREYTDIWNGHYDDFQSNIIGVEVFKSNFKNCLVDNIYDKIYYDKIQNVYGKIKNLDMSFFCDVIEHMSKEDGKFVLDFLKENSKVSFISTPLNPGNRGGGMYGNEYEAHISKWSVEELSEYGIVTLYKNHTILLEILN